MSDLLAVELPKWPGLTVAGDPVTEDQAAEIIVRTNLAWIGGNDQEWKQAVRAVLGLPDDDDWSEGRWAQDEAAWEAIRHIGLDYLVNTQIISAYLGGPHGWMHWDGTVGCSGFNIGKWPSVEEVRDEWQDIAEAWPFLTLRSQLLSGEWCEDDAVPVVEFRVSGGRVEVVAPEGVLAPPPSTVPAPFDPLTIFDEGRERGCTLEQLEHAVALAREAAVR